jgi:hypothetical protein
VDEGRKSASAASRRRDSRGLLRSARLRRWWAGGDACRVHVWHRRQWLSVDVPAVPARRVKSTATCSRNPLRVSSRWRVDLAAFLARARAFGVPAAQIARPEAPESASQSMGCCN